MFNALWRPLARSTWPPCGSTTQSCRFKRRRTSQRLKITQTMAPLCGVSEFMNCVEISWGGFSCRRLVACTRNFTFQNWVFWWSCERIQRLSPPRPQKRDFSPEYFTISLSELWFLGGCNICIHMHLLSGYLTPTRCKCQHLGMSYLLRWQCDTVCVIRLTRNIIWSCVSSMGGGPCITNTPLWTSAATLRGPKMWERCIFYFYTCGGEIERFRSIFINEYRRAFWVNIFEVQLDPSCVLIIMPCRLGSGSFCTVLHWQQQLEVLGRVSGGRGGAKAPDGNVSSTDKTSNAISLFGFIIFFPKKCSS